MKIVADRHIPFVKHYFSDYDLHLFKGREINRELLQDAEMLLVRSVTRVDSALLKNTKVKFVGSVTAGADHLDLSWLREANIVVKLATGFNAPPVADYIVSVIAALQSSNVLQKSPIRAGVIGVGCVGKLCQEKLSALNYELMLNDPLRATAEPQFHSHELNDFEDLDLITIHVPLTYDHHPTYHFIDDTFLKRQKPGCILINASRGAVIDTNALLHSGKHLKWCFDVWENEPNIPAQILSEALIATPHIAGYSVQSKQRGIAMIYEAAVKLRFIQNNKKHDDLPTLTINAKGEEITWQSFVLSLFNPLQMTKTMKESLLSSSDRAHLFDQLRLDFNNRYEIGSVMLSHAVLKEEDARVLKRFGVELVHCE